MVVAGPLTDAVGARWVSAARAACIGVAAVAALRARCAASGSTRSERAGGGRRPRDGGRRDWTRETLVAGVRAGDRRALARAITLVENGDPLAYELVRDVYPDTGRALRRRRHRPARRRQVEPHLGARPPRARAATGRSA